MKNKDVYKLDNYTVDMYQEDDRIPELVLYDENDKTIFKTNGYSMCLVLQNFIDWLEKEYVEPIKLTDDEKAILRSLPKEYKWIARNVGDWLCIYTNKPTRDNIMWNSCDGYKYWIDIFNHLFQFIKWEDEEPYSIEELLKNE